MKFDVNNLPALKIRVNNAAESERAQRAFFALGGKWLINGHNVSFAKKQFLFLTDGMIEFANEREVGHFNADESTEITLLELEALAAEKQGYRLLNEGEEVMQFDEIFDSGHWQKITSGGRGEQNPTVGKDGVGKFRRKVNPEADWMDAEIERKPETTVTEVCTLPNGLKVWKRTGEAGETVYYGENCGAPFPIWSTLNSQDELRAILHDLESQRPGYTEQRNEAERLLWKIRCEMIADLTKDPSKADDPYLAIRDTNPRTYTRNELAKAIANETPDGLDCLTRLLNLTADLMLRGKEPQPTAQDATLGEKFFAYWEQEHNILTLHSDFVEMQRLFKADEHSAQERYDAAMEYYEENKGYEACDHFSALFKALKIAAGLPTE